MTTNQKAPSAIEAPETLAAEAVLPVVVIETWAELVTRLEPTKFWVREFDAEAENPLDTYDYNKAEMDKMQEQTTNNFYYYLNGTDKQKPKALKAVDFPHARGFVIDVDADKGHVLPESFHYPPTYILETSAESYQVVWLLEKPEAIAPTAYTAMCEQLFNHYHTDSKVKGLQQIIRLPETRNSKPDRDGFIGKFVTSSFPLVPLTASEFIGLLPPTATKAQLPQIVRDKEGNSHELKKYHDRLANAPKGEREFTLLRTASYMAGVGIERDKAYDCLLTAWTDLGGTLPRFEDKFNRGYDNGLLHPIIKLTSKAEDAEKYFACVSILQNQNLRTCITMTKYIGNQKLEGDWRALLLGWFRKEHFYISNTTFTEALDVVFAENKFNPMAEYFDALPPYDASFWGTSCPFTELFKESLREQEAIAQQGFIKWFVGCTSRWQTPGTRHELMLVLQSYDQGKGKSLFLESLMPNPDLYKELALGENDDENTRKMATTMLANLDEYGTSARKKDVEAIKGMLTEKNASLRLMRKEAYTIPKHWCFAATTNNDTPLTDVQNRRFVMLKFEEDNYINHEWLTQPSLQPGLNNRDALFACALSMLADGFKPWFDKEEVKAVNEHNKQYTSDENPMDITLFAVLQTLALTKRLVPGYQLPNTVLYPMMEEAGHGVKHTGAEGRLVSERLKQTFKCKPYRKTAGRGFEITEATCAVVTAWREATNAAATARPNPGIEEEPDLY
jgi:Virulence-associated protein E/RepB DNA-primase from phage plasmid